jgi:hypothetical protein
VLVLMMIPVFTGCLVDRGVPDEKVLDVALGDPYADELADLGDTPVVRGRLASQSAWARDRRRRDREPPP